MLEFQPLFEAGELARELLLLKEFIVDIQYKTKTTVSIHVGVGRYRFKLNPVNEKFNQLIKVENNIWSNTRHESGYFKLTKKQGYKELVDYIQESLRNSFSVIKEPVILNFWITNAYQTIKLNQTENQELCSRN